MSPRGLGATTLSLERALNRAPLLAAFHATGRNNGLTVSSRGCFRVMHLMIRGRLAATVSIRLFRRGRTVVQVIRLTRIRNVGMVVDDRSFGRAPASYRVCCQLREVTSLKTSITGVTIVPRGPTSILALLSTARRTGRGLSLPLVAVTVKSLNGMAQVTNTIFKSTLAFNAINATSTPNRLDVTSLERTLTGLEVWFVERSKER